MSESNVHKNHRARMRERLFNNGADSFHDHELLEMFLFMSDRRRDTNELAHIMLEKFGSLKNIFSASPEQLYVISGIKEVATANILVTREIMRRIEMEYTECPKSLDRTDAIGEYFVRKFKFSPVEEFYLMLFGNGMVVKDCILISRGDAHFTKINIKNIMKEVVIHDATAVVVAHNHPNGDLMASSADALMTRDIALALKSIDVELVDHILVANNKYATIMHTRYNI